MIVYDSLTSLTLDESFLGGVGESFHAKTGGRSQYSLLWFLKKFNNQRENNLY